MDSLLTHRAPPAPTPKPTTNGAATSSISDRIPHTQERNLPGGANWVVQKFGGTSVGKFAVKIAEDIILYVYIPTSRRYVAV